MPADWMTFVRGLVVLGTGLLAGAALGAGVIVVAGCGEVVEGVVVVVSAVGSGVRVCCFSGTVVRRDAAEEAGAVCVFLACVWPDESAFISTKLNEKIKATVSGIPSNTVCVFTIRNNDRVLLRGKCPP